MGESERRCLAVMPELGYRKAAYRQAMLELAAEGEISIAESRLLAALVVEAGTTGPLVEIGSLFGQSTRILLTMKGAGQQVISVDNYSWNPLGLPASVQREILNEQLRESIDAGEITLIESDKNDFYAGTDIASPALVFLDAIHSYEETMKDIAWARNVRARIICGHDYCEKSFPGVVQAVHENGGPGQLQGTLWSL